MKELHKAFRKILEDMNAEFESDLCEERVEKIIRAHLESALHDAGKEIEKLFGMKNVVVSAQIREVCVYSKKQGGEDG